MTTEERSTPQPEPVTDPGYWPEDQRDNGFGAQDAVAWERAIAAQRRQQAALRRRLAAEVTP